MHRGNLHQRLGTPVEMAARLRTMWQASGALRFPASLVAWAVRPLFEVAVCNLSDGLPQSPEARTSELRPLQVEDLAQLARVHPSLSAASMKRRLDEGAKCYVRWIEGLPAHWRWQTDREIYLSYLDARVRPHAGVLLTVDVFTHPGFRNQGLYTSASLWALHQAKRDGYRRVIGLVGNWNQPVKEVMTSKTGFSFQGRVGVWVLGNWQRHFARGEVPFDIVPG